MASSCIGRKLKLGTPIDCLNYLRWFLLDVMSHQVMVFLCCDLFFYWECLPREHCSAQDSQSGTSTAYYNRVSQANFYWRL